MTTYRSFVNPKVNTLRLLPGFLCCLCLAGLPMAAPATDYYVKTPAQGGPERHRLQPVLCRRQAGTAVAIRRRLDLWAFPRAS